MISLLKDLQLCAAYKLVGWTNAETTSTGLRNDNRHRKEYLIKTRLPPISLNCLSLINKAESQGIPTYIKVTFAVTKKVMEEPT